MVVVKTNARLAKSSPQQSTQNVVKDEPKGFSKTMFGQVILKKNSVNEMSNE